MEQLSFSIFKTCFVFLRNAMLLAVAWKMSGYAVITELARGYKQTLWLC